MEPLFSEFSYGYAITEELTSGKFGQIIGAPKFPSLYDEGQTGGGYDVQLPIIGAPLFLQYKLSHYLWRSNASEWGFYNEPYYRMYLRPLRHSDQHNLLIDLEEKGNEVYYVAPDFHTVEELDEYYISDTVAQNSAFYSPLDIGRLPDEYQHYITFIPSSSAYFLFSEEQRKVMTRYSKDNFEKRQIDRLRQKPFKMDTHYLNNLASDLIAILEESIVDKKRIDTLRNQSKQRETIRDKVGFISYLSRTYIDTELIIISQKD